MKKCGSEISGGGGSFWSRFVRREQPGLEGGPRMLPEKETASIVRMILYRHSLVWHHENTRSEILPQKGATEQGSPGFTRLTISSVRRSSRKFRYGCFADG